MAIIDGNGKKEQFVIAATAPFTDQGGVPPDWLKSSHLKYNNAHNMPNGNRNNATEPYCESSAVVNSSHHFSMARQDVTIPKQTRVNAQITTLGMPI